MKQAARTIGNIKKDLGRLTMKSICGMAKARKAAPDPKYEKLSETEKVAYQALHDAMQQTMAIANREASPRLKVAMTNEALARFDWQQAHQDRLLYAYQSKPKESSRRLSRVKACNCGH